MSRLFYHVMQDNVGNLLFDVSGTMRLAGSGTLATIYGDEALTVILPNPMTNHPSFGSFKCFLPSGDFDFYMAKSGYTFETLTGVQGHGSMAQQDAGAVLITGGYATLTQLTVPTLDSGDGVGVQIGMEAGGTFRRALYVSGTAESQIAGPLSLQGLVTFTGRIGVNSVPGTEAMRFAHDKTTQQGIVFQPLGTEGGTAAIIFNNIATAAVGSIISTATATAYNTTSDARLKHAITALTGALDKVQALRPVHFLWNANDEPGEGFLAHELMRHVPAAVTGQPDEVNDDGSIRPQQVDHSRIIPWVTAALQETLAQVQALTARVAALEQQLGV